MSKKKRRPSDAAFRTARRRQQRTAIQPIIDSIQQSLDRFQAAYDDDRDLDPQMSDLLCVVADLEDAVEKQWQAEADEATARALRERRPSGGSR